MRQAAGGIISFSLATRAETGSGALVANAQNGRSLSADVDPGEGGVANEIELDRTQWHDVWVVVSAGTGLSGPTCALKVCPLEGDTRCTGLELVQVGGTTAVLATATTEDDSGDAVIYTFAATKEGEDPVVVGPQSANSATLELSAGEWTVAVTVDDDPDCDDPPGTCSETIAVEEPGGLQKPSDLNQDARFDLADAIALLGHLFRGEFRTLPCGDGTLRDPAVIALLDVNGDGRVDLSDAVSVSRVSPESDPIFQRETAMRSAPSQKMTSSP